MTDLSPSSKALVPFVSVHNMMQLIHHIGIEPMLVGLGDYIEADFRRWELFDKTPRVASHSENGVIELMPDHALFGVLHSGPLNLPIGKRLFLDLWNDRVSWIKKIGCVHLNRSSPVFAMMSAIFGGDPDSPGASIGWICYGLAISQYLVIALMTSTDKAGDLLAKYDRTIAEQREDLVDEFTEHDDEDEAPTGAGTPSQ